MIRVSVVSGGFDPVHRGHVDMFRDAADLGKLIVLLNSDEWLTRKKGRPFMDWAGRRAVIAGMKWVDQVWSVDDSDGTVCAGLREIRSQYPDAQITFCNGGDRFADNVPEVELCRELKISCTFRVGGGKVESSSTLVKGALTAETVEKRMAAGYTQAQAERRPGWWRARTRLGDGSWSDVMEFRDSEGQLIERMTMEDFKATAAQDLRVLQEREDR